MTHRNHAVNRTSMGEPTRADRPGARRRARLRGSLGPSALFCAVAACHSAPAAPARSQQPLTMTYLGVAGWQIESAGTTRGGWSW